MRYNILIVLILVLIVVGTLFTINFKPGNVIVEYQESFRQGDPLSGKLTITIEQGDSLDASIPIIVSLSNEAGIIEAKTLRLSEFMQISDNPTQPVKKENSLFYDTPGLYSVDINKIIQYKFQEKGQYELLFNIVKINLAIKKSIIVD
ncbi:hypothetical protein J4217_02575 [Candidatus Pacearchaeota archaeon]|nr:hypothetical protein [Candidatus Pacearchaeota archaeon]